MALQVSKTTIKSCSADNEFEFFLIFLFSNEIFFLSFSDKISTIRFESLYFVKLQICRFPVTMKTSKVNEKGKIFTHLPPNPTIPLLKLKFRIKLTRDCIKLYIFKLILIQNVVTKLRQSCFVSTLKNFFFLHSLKYNLRQEYST